MTRSPDRGRERLAFAVVAAAAVTVDASTGDPALKSRSSGGSGAAGDADDEEDKTGIAGRNCGVGKLTISIAVKPAKRYVYPTDADEEEDEEEATAAPFADGGSTMGRRSNSSNNSHSNSSKSSGSAVSMYNYLQRTA
jgi:hypothetical protein